MRVTPGGEGLLQESHSRRPYSRGEGLFQEELLQEGGRLL